MSDVLILGLACHDTVVTVDSYPSCDTKNVVTSKSIFGGGNGGTVAIANARLGKSTQFVTTFYKDLEGISIRKDFEDEGVQLDYSDTREEGKTGTSYIIVDAETRGRTIFHSPMDPNELVLQASREVDWDYALAKSSVIFTDGRFPETVLPFLQKIACKKTVLMDCERLRGPETMEMIKYCRIISCAETFLDIIEDQRITGCEQQDALIRKQRVAKDLIAPAQSHEELRKQVEATIAKNLALYTEVNTFKSNNDNRRGSSSEKAENLDFPSEILHNLIAKTRQLQSLLHDYPQLSVAIVTLGSHGSLCICNAPSLVDRRLFWTPSWKPSNRDVIDTCGAGDSFNGGLVYGISQVNALNVSGDPNPGWSIEQTVAFACLVAGYAVTKMGSRTGLPVLRREKGDKVVNSDSSVVCTTNSTNAENEYLYSNLIETNQKRSQNFENHSTKGIPNVRCDYMSFADTVKRVLEQNV